MAVGGTSASSRDPVTPVSHAAASQVVPDLLGNDPEWCCVMHADGAGCGCASTSTRLPRRPPAPGTTSLSHSPVSPWENAVPAPPRCATAGHIPSPPPHLSPRTPLPLSPRRQHQVLARLHVLARDGRPVRLARDRSGRNHHERRRPAVRRRRGPPGAAAIRLVSGCAPEPRRHTHCLGGTESAGTTVLGPGYGLGRLCPHAC